jgi:multidrug efflux pump subunit AcrA (membrane-fusion protein)
VIVTERAASAFDDLWRIAVATRWGLVMMGARRSGRAARTTTIGAWIGIALPMLAAGPAMAASADRAVTVAAAKRMCFTDTLQVTGVIVPRHDVLVRPDREGWQISQVLVEPGDTVKANQALAQLAAPEGSQSSGSSSVTVQAPAAGVIYSASAIIGATASERAAPLFRIARQGEMELLAETPVNTMEQLAVDQAAKVEIIGVGELSGKVRLVASAINPTTQLGQVHVFIGTDKRLRVGTFGRAIINIDRRCGPTIPLSAVLYGEGAAIVQVVRDDRIETRRVSVGLMENGQIEIRDGVAVGDIVVVRAGAFVRDGDRVRPIADAQPTTSQNR